jgi:hypothetical protein
MDMNNDQGSIGEAVPEAFDSKILFNELKSLLMIFGTLSELHEHCFWCISMLVWMIHPHHISIVPSYFRRCCVLINLQVHAKQPEPLVVGQPFSQRITCKKPCNKTEDCSNGSSNNGAWRTSY